MYVDKLYRMISTRQIAENRYINTIRFLAEDPVFTGHFPQQAIVPGVVELALVQNSLNTVYGEVDTAVQLVSLSSCKFLMILEPRADNSVDVEVKWEEIKATEREQISVQARVYWGENTYMKMSGVYQVVR